MWTYLKIFKNSDTILNSQEKWRSTSILLLIYTVMTFVTTLVFIVSLHTHRTVPLNYSYMLNLVLAQDSSLLCCHYRIEERRAGIICTIIHFSTNMPICLLLLLTPCAWHGTNYHLQLLQLIELHTILKHKNTVFYLKSIDHSQYTSYDYNLIQVHHTTFQR